MNDNALFAGIILNKFYSVYIFCVHKDFNWFAVLFEKRKKKTHVSLLY